MSDSLKGPLVLAFSREDPGAAARVIKGFAKDHEKLVPVAVALGGELIDAKDIGRVAALPTLDEARAHLAHVDGVMLGRAAYQTPWLLASADRMFFGDDTGPRTRDAVLDATAAYADDHVARGGRLNNVTRHMLGLYHGQAGGRLFRRHIAEHAAGQDTAHGDVLRAAGRIVAETREAMRRRQGDLETVT